MVDDAEHHLDLEQRVMALENKIDALDTWDFQNSILKLQGEGIAKQSNSVGTCGFGSFPLHACTTALITDWS